VNVVKSVIKTLMHKRDKEEKTVAYVSK